MTGVTFKLGCDATVLRAPGLYWCKNAGGEWTVIEIMDAEEYTILGNEVWRKLSELDPDRIGPRCEAPA